MAIDSSLSTRWTTNATQRSGQYFEIDLGSESIFDHIILDSVDSPNDEPGGYEVYVSASPFGASLGNPIISGSGSADGITTISFAQQNARYIRIIQTGSSDTNWWSVHDLIISYTGEALPGDEDNDGVNDEEDECPGTPFGTVVDEVGCQLAIPPVTAGNILVFSKTAAFSHDSILAGQNMLRELADQNGWTIEFTVDGSEFNADRLAEFNTVVWLSTTGDVLNNAQQDAFEDYIENGGGYVGIHSASDTEYDWPWYGDLVGAYFLNHPPGQQTAVIDVEDSNHPSTSHLAATWTHRDEWYNFQMNPRSNVNVVLSVDESSYDPGANAMGDHPISWYHDVGAGRSFYTALGHTDDAYNNSTEFRQHIEGAINWAGNLAAGVPTWVGPPPAAFDFESVSLADGLNLPMALDISESGDIYAIGRFGSFYAFQDDEMVETSLIETDTGGERGLIGFALDPDFTDNRLAYFHYTHPSNGQHILSRIKINDDNSLDRSSETQLLSYPYTPQACCHSGGDLDFGPDGNLYISTGDDTTPSGSNGYAPLDERSERVAWDSQKSSANTNDLRGKILRIRPTASGGYTIPEGNLFSSDSEHRAEIYIMGNRNPFRMAIDAETNTLFWGDVGPDANSASANRGPTGYDEINRANAAGNYGWPYFAGNNEAYNDYDFDTGDSGEKFNPSAPINDSPNNTGTTILPAAIPSWVKMSHRATMVADVYRWDTGIEDPYRLPSYFHGRLIYWNFNNDQMFEASVSENAPELRNWMTVSALRGVIDGKVSPVNNRLYLLGYGNNCCGSTPGRGGLIEVRYVGEPLAADLTSHIINTGGGDYTSSDNTEFVADRFFNAGRDHTSTNDISGTVDDEVFQSHHWHDGEFSYNFPIASGDYTVELLFSEVFFTQIGQRIFSVAIEDQAFINDLDVFAEVGVNQPLNEVFDIRVNDGSLDITFTPDVENPMISGIRILPKSVVDVGSTLAVSAGANGLFLTADGDGALVAAGLADNNDSAIEVRIGLNGGVSFYSIALDRYLSVSGDSLQFDAENVGIDESFRVTNESSSFGIIALSNNRYFTVDSSTTPAQVLVNGIEFSSPSIFNIQASEPCDLSSAGEHGIDCRPAAKAYLNFPENPDAGYTGIPTVLSQTGAFSNVANMVPSENLIPYDMINPLWSDRAVKSRWVSIPSGTKVEYYEDTKWQWPAGTVFIKHFSLPLDEGDQADLKRLETRFVIVKEGGDIYAVTYKWRDDNSDADLLKEGLDEEHTILAETGPYVQTWTYPSPEDCVNCHNEDAEGVLGPKTASFNGSLTYPSGVSDNQLSTWNHLGLFDAPIDEVDLSTLPRHAAIDDESASLELRVRSYWDTNCASCHGPKGIAAMWDARFDTPLFNQGVVNEITAEQRDYLEDYGLAEPLMVDPGNIDNSILYIRDKSIDEDDRMPPLGKNLEDEVYINVLERWINSLSE